MRDPERRCGDVGRLGAALDIGESFVGAYLRHVRGCSVVVYNGFLTDQQGEVDVVGIEPTQSVAGNPLEGRTVWLCEVTTHVRGLNASGRKRAPEKLRRLREFAQLTFPGDAIASSRGART